MEGHEQDAERWVESLARRANGKAVPPGDRAPNPPAVMLKLQAYDWAEEEWVPAEELAAMARGARRALAENLGVYPVLPEEGDIPEGILGESVPSAASDRYPGGR